MNTWFSVSKDGLRSIVSRRGKPRTILELVQNAWDADGTTKVDVTVEAYSENRTRLVVEDDSPNGFADLSHAYTLFAPSGKVGDPEKRGRFNLGEKLILSVCDSASITSTRGGWFFREDGTRVVVDDVRTSGSRFDAVIRFDDEEREEALEALRTLIPPVNIRTVINGVELPQRETCYTDNVTLPTEIAGTDGMLRPTRRKTLMRLYKVLEGETAHLYEMGVPVVEVDMPYHVDISQKVPLNMERDNVTPAYLREVRVRVLNLISEELPQLDASAAWVRDALSDSRVNDDAVRDVVEARFGKKAVIYDPSDREANNIAVMQGYSVVHGGSLSKREWEQVKNSGALQPAGQVTPSPNPNNGDGAEVPQTEWSESMKTVAVYASKLGAELLGYVPAVEIRRTSKPFLAWFGGRKLTFNLERLGDEWFTALNQQKVDELLIHEFAHDKVENHLSREFYDECCRLGAKLRYAKSSLL